MHENSLKIMKSLIKKYPPKGPVLDVGSYDVNGSYRPLFEGIPYTGIDIAPGKGVDIVVKEHSWEALKGQKFPFMISGQCLEHTRRPWEVMCRMANHLDGTLIVIVPFMFPIHRYPIDCYRFAPDGLESLAEYAGLRVLETGLSQFGEEQIDAWLVASSS